MEKPTVVLFRSVLLLAGLNAALAQDETIYVAVGGTLELSPPFSGPITSLLWKHVGNMVVEWVDEKLNKTYGNFQNRTTLDKITGMLEITAMTAADAGRYTVEINKKVEGRGYIVNVMKKVPKPTVEFQPLTCPASNNCGLSCEGETTGAEPVEYSWKIGEEPWVKGGKTMSITRADNKHDKTFICRMKNPVSVEESEPKENPFYEEVEISNGPAIAVGVTVSILFAAALAAAGLGYWKRDEIMTCFRGCFANNGVADVEGGATGVALTSAVANSNEGSAPASGDAEGQPQVETPATTGENTNEVRAPEPAAENGVKTPSDNADDPDENTTLVPNAAP